MNMLKQLFLLLLGSLLMNASYAQCPIGETEITIQFIEEGDYPSEVDWDYKIGGVLSDAGPYTTTDIITTCVPEGELTIVGCDEAGDSWNGATFEVQNTEDGSINNCSTQNGCLLYRSNLSDGSAVRSCSLLADYEIATLSIGACNNSEVILTGCTSPLAVNFNTCATTDDGTCIFAAENNSCENAILINVLEEDCTEYIYEYYNPNGTIDILRDCHNFLSFKTFNTVIHDGFYKIIVPSSGQFRFVTDYYDAIALYKNCNEEPIFCGAVNHFNNLTPGDTLILQISNISFAERNIEFCLQATAPTENSDCVDATFTEVVANQNCDENYIKLTGLRDNALNIIPACDSTAINDAFYQFIVPPSGNIKITKADNNFGSALYNSCTKESLFCESNNYQQVITNLTAGDTLLIQVFGKSIDTEINFCLEEAIPSENNNCINATFINVLENNNITYFDTYNNVDKPAICNGNFNKINADAFFSFVVPPSGQVRLSSPYADLFFAVYDNCNNDEAIQCGISTNQLINNLTPGDTLLFQVASALLYLEQISFSLINAPPTPNNNCTNAKFIEVATIDDYFIRFDTLYINNNSVDIYPECSYDANYDSFYQFVVPPSGAVALPRYDYFGFSVFESCELGSIFCEPAGYEDVEIYNLTRGDTLLLQVFDNIAYNNLFIHLEEIAPSLNNSCANAQFLNVASSGECNSNQVDLNLKYNTLNNMPACNSSARFDAFYELTVPPSGSIKIEVSNAIGLALYNSCNGNTVYCDDYFEIDIIPNLTRGETLLLQIFPKFNRQRLSFCIEEVTPSINNNCINATPIIVAESGNCETHSVALNNLDYNTVNIEPSCDNSILYDAFYELTVPESGQIFFSTKSTVGLAIYQACNGRSLFCEDRANSEIIRNLPAGETVILQIFEDNNQPDFSFCLEDVVPAMNNLCVNAEPFIVNEPGTCEGNYIQVENNNNTSDINPYCADFVMADVFYSFIVPESGQVKISTSESVGIAIYDDCLEQSYYCSGSFESKVIYDLNPTDTLILQVFQTNPSSLELCLEDAPPSVNNNCMDATPLQIYNEGLCIGNLTVAPLSNNSVSINPSCEYITADIFYRVTVPENGQFRVLSNTYNFGVAIYNTCGFNSLICKSSLNENLIQGLPANEEVLLQFFQDGTPGDFEFCLEDAPYTINNDCVDALSIDVFNEEECVGNVITASLSNNTVNINPTCDVVTADIFYRVTVPENGQFRIAGSNSNVGFSIYSTCGTNSLVCKSRLNNNLLNNLPPNEEVILQFFAYITIHDFEFCLETAIPTANNDCSNATPIEVLPSYEILELSNFFNIENNNLSVTPVCYNDVRDAFYEFTVPENGKLAFNSLNRIGIAVYKECGGESYYCDSYIDNTVITDLPAGETMILQIFDRFDYDNVTFAITHVAENYNCTNATLLCETNTKGSNVGTTERIYRVESDCISFSGDLNNTAWYRFNTNNLGDSVTFEITKTQCSYQYENLYASILIDGCQDEDYVEMACLKINNDGEKGIFTFTNPLPNSQYYLVVGNESYYENCSFEIEVLSGIEFNCCQLNYTTSNWCYNINPNNYFVDLTINDLGQNPSGYQIVGTNQQITEPGTTTIGPIPNGMNTITLQGIDQQDCVAVETIHFNCADCAYELKHSNTSIERDYEFKAAGTIESNIWVMPAATLTYQAGDSIILKQGFTVEKGAGFSIDTKDCDE